MTDPAATPQMRRIFADIERRLRNLEGAPQLQRASFAGGTIAALDDDGTRVAEFGLLADGKYGLSINEGDDQRALLYVNHDRGYYLPVLEHAFTQAASGVIVTSGSFTTCFTALVPVPLAPTLILAVAATCDAATTGELRLVLSTGPTSDVATLAAGVQTSTQYQWEYGGAIGLGTSGFFVNVQARRTGGAGNVFIHFPRPLRQTAVYGVGTAGGL